MINGTYTVSGPVNEIAVHNIPCTVNISNEKSDEITYTIYEDMADSLVIELVDGVLQIDKKPGSRFQFNPDNMRDKIVFNIGSDTLSKLETSSYLRVISDGTISADTFTVDVSGVISGDIDLEAESVMIDVSGTGVLTLTGSAEDLNINLSGASYVNAINFQAENVEIHISGASSADIYANGTLDINLSGVGSIKYWGDPQVTQQVSGIGSVKKGD